MAGVTVQPTILQLEGLGIALSLPLGHKLVAEVPYSYLPL